MKICPFMSHMLGADGNIMEIDGSAQRAAADAIVLGYEDNGAVGVKTERKPARTSGKAAREANQTASHLYCLRETCRFYHAKNSECTFDAIMEGIDKQSQALAEVKTTAESSRKDNTATTVARELDKFWKFQTKSVSEMISSIGETEKRQNESLSRFVGDIEKRVIAFMDDEDTRDERMNSIRDGVAEIKDTIDARNDGFETLTTTVSDLVLSFEDSLKELKSQWDSLSSHIEAMAGMSEKLAAIDKLSSRIEQLEDFTSQIGSLEGVVAKMDSMESNVSRTVGNLDRLERNWAELMDAVKASGKKGEDTAAQARRREAMKFNNLGVTSFHNGDLKLARDQFLEAVNRDGSFAECFNNLGLVYTELGESDLAADAFSRAIKLNPELHAAYNNLGYVFYKQGSYDRAIEMYNEALGRSSNNSSAYTNLGNAHFKLGNKTEARRAWEKAIELDPGNDNARRSLRNLGD
ncbi:MAG TPA: tetratricopeptide repeat protein [Candidatus Krumholzibacteria bacterium]|nr:tetratricopeptide repeat protein [Candidatus Krumholzibacteria bacterium]